MLLDPDPEQHSQYEFGSRSRSQMSADSDQHDWFFDCLLAVNFSCKNSTFCETDQENLFYSLPFCRSLGCPGPWWRQSHTGSVLIPNIDDLLYCRYLFFTTTHGRFVSRIRESRAVETNCSPLEILVRIRICGYLWLMDPDSDPDPQHLEIYFVVML